MDVTVFYLLMPKMYKFIAKKNSIKPYSIKP